MRLPAPSNVIPHKLVPPIDTSRWRNEGSVKTMVKLLLNHWGWYTWMPGANGFGQQGVHDHLAFKDGVFLTVEDKFGRNKPSALQRSFAGHIMANDGFSFCVNEHNIDHFAWWLESFEFAKHCQMEGLEVPAEHGARMLNAISALTDGWAAPA